MSSIKKKVKWTGYLGIIFDTHFIPLQNEPSPILVGPKALGFWVPENITFQESGCNVEKWMNRRNQHKEPIEGIKVWLLLGYPSNILGYPSKYWNYSSKMKLGWFPHSPPQWITFLIFTSQKILLNIKDVEFDFRMGSIIV